MVIFCITLLAFLFVAYAFYKAGYRAAQLHEVDRLRSMGYQPGTPLKTCDRTDGHDGPCNGLPRKACVTDFVASAIAQGFARALPCGCLDVCTNQRDHDVPAGTRQPHELDTFGNCPECAEMGARSLRERYPADFVEVPAGTPDDRDDLCGRHG